jgi:hypothetical protein
MKSLFSFLLILFWFSVSAQTQLSDSEIAKTMQKYSDTTIIVQYPSIWNGGPKLYFLSKKGDTLSCYLYKNIEQPKLINEIPKILGMKIFTPRIEEFLREPVRINRYFNVKNVQPDILLNFWKQVSAIELWKIKDDAAEGSGCPIDKEKGTMEIEDAGGIYILLITKESIKPLIFYAPNEFEGFCPGRKGRQSAIKLSVLFDKIFKL